MPITFVSPYLARLAVVFWGWLVRLSFGVSFNVELRQDLWREILIRRLKCRAKTRRRQGVGVAAQS